MAHDLHVYACDRNRRDHPRVTDCSECACKVFKSRQCMAMPCSSNPILWFEHENVLVRKFESLCCVFGTSVLIEAHTRHEIKA